MIDPNMKTSFEFLLYSCLLLFTADVRGFITQNPFNAVIEGGRQAIFNCTSDTTQQNWVFSTKRDDVGTPSAQIIVLNCMVQTAFITHYDVDRPGGSNNKCNLIVKVTTMQQAGVYTCTDAAPGQSAILTVIGPSPIITVNNTSDTITVVEKESVIIECVLNHNGSIPPAPTLWPYFYWTNSTGQTVSSSYDSTTANTAVSQITVTAGRQNITEYTCHVYLQLIPPNTTNYDSTTPNVSSKASSKVIEVLYGPSTPVITSRPDVISINGVPCGISVLTCSSTANPAPSYRWYDSAENVVLSATDTLDLAEVHRNYKCEAYNTIGTVLYNASTTYIVSKVNCTSTVDCCVFPQNKTTSIMLEDCDNGTRCDCSQGTSGLILRCSAQTFPNASYMWSGPDIQPIDSSVYDQVKMNGTYRCTAYFNKTSSNYTGNAIFTNGTDKTNVLRCCEPWELIISVLIPYFGWNVIVLVVFLVVYSRNIRCRNIMDQGFPGHTTFCLLVIASVFFGLIIIPIVVTIAYARGQDNPLTAASQEIQAPHHIEISILMIVGMWCFAIALLIPTAFVVVYFVHCNEMRFEIS